MLASFSGKTPDWSVQMPWVSLAVISAASKNAEPTFLFLEWLADKKQQDKLIALGQGGVPIRSSSWIW